LRFADVRKHRPQADVMKLPVFDPGQFFTGF
jgi:hypothetical protein